MQLVLNSVFLLVAVLLFTKGFLLMKLEIGEKSPTSSPSSNLSYSKVVILIIDALRYDFAFYADEGDDQVQIFQNNMPIFHELIQKEGCKKARLWRFKADAPTTTMQRLKGLTTGSLPTFIDLSRNFASSEITEDNILDQFRASGKNITFMGDDTWMGLFPGRFNKAFPYPSFDVKDLHLVDNGVLNHLLPEIGTTDWQMLIAHFLGVDHCGHRYGPYHAEMPLKLKQMNQVVSDVVDAIDSQTLLLVMGDHGMTPTGDHGGETFNEVNAALFAYSPTGAFQPCDGTENSDIVVNQVDIVPTISLLLGMSIPFANLGVVIGDMLPSQSKTLGNFEDALVINAKQIHTYISTYQKITNSLPQESYKKLLNDYEGLNKSDERTRDKERKILEYIKSAKEMCQLVWAKFNVALMLSSLSLLVLWLIRNLKSSPVASFGCFVLFLFTFVSIGLSVMMTSDLNDAFSLVICCCSFLLLGVTGVVILWEMRLTSSLLLKVIIPVCFLAFYAISFTSNSFILNEDLTALYLFISVFLCLGFQSFLTDNDHKKVKPGPLRSDETTSNDLTAEDAKSELIRRKKVGDISNYEEGETSQNEPPLVVSFQTVLYSFVGVFSARLCFMFRSCRAEQFWCFDDASTDDLGTQFNSIGVRVVSSSLTLLASVLTVSGVLTKGQNLKTCFPIICLIISSSLCAFGWFYHHFETSYNLPDWYSAVLPRCVYAILVVFFIFHWIDPISSCLPNLNYSLESFSDASQNEKPCPGRRQLREKRLSTLGSIFNAFVSSTVIMTLGLVCLFCLLLGPGMGTSIPLWLVSAFCTLQLMPTSADQTSLEFVPFSYVIVWNIMGSYWWFATGHQPSISSIRWDAAFVGFQGNHVTNVIPGLLLILDTFSIQILTSISLPLLIIWGRKNKLPVNNFDNSNGVKNIKETVNFSAWYETAFQKALNDVFFKHYCFHVVRMIGCMVSASLHRRHLMVWWIFAPKFLFEGLSFIIVLFATLLSYAFAQNVGRKLKAIEPQWSPRGYFFRSWFCVQYPKI